MPVRCTRVSIWRYLVSGVPASTGGLWEALGAWQKKTKDRRGQRAAEGMYEAEAGGRLERDVAGGDSRIPKRC